MYAIIATGGKQYRVSEGLSLIHIFHRCVKHFADAHAPRVPLDVDAHLCAPLIRRAGMKYACVRDVHKRQSAMRAA